MLASIRHTDSTHVIPHFVGERFCAIINFCDKIEVYYMSSLIHTKNDWHIDIINSEFHNNSSIIQIHHNIAPLIVSIENLYKRIVRLFEILYNKNQSYENRQICLTLLSIVRQMCGITSDLMYNFEKLQLIDFITKEQTDKITQLINLYTQSCEKFESTLAQNTDFTLLGSTLKNYVQNQKLTIPIRIRLDDDDTGICATCLEIPQVYGFGENKNEALSMLDREILSLYTDIQEDIPLSDEYRLLKEHLDLLFDK